MSGNPVFESAWRLLKDYDFVGHLPQGYYNTLPDRMVRLMESGDTLEHVNVRPTEHYNERIRQRYNSDQALPPEFQKRGMRKYRFTLESILNFMANDLARNHPELLEAMSEPKRAGDPKLPDMPPSMMFDAMYTDDPKVDESEKQRGLSHRVSPHFVLNDEGKLQLATVGHGKLSDKEKQSIQVVPTTSLLNDMHDNSAIDERLPNRFDFLDRGTPDMPEMPVEEESPLPQTFSPQEKDYSNLPPAYREAARLADEQKNASEPMDIVMRLLKAPVYDTDIPGIQFVTQGEDEADWSKDPTVYGANMGLSHVPEEEHPLAEIKMITPNQFLAMTPKEGMDESSPYYEDLMDRAQAGEDVKFTMPHVDTGIFPPGHPQHEPELNFHNGRHRMQELVRRGHGDIPVPVHYTELSMQDPSDPYFSPDVIDFPSHNRIETGEPMDLAMRLLKGEFGPTDEEIPYLEDFESWYNQHYKTTPQEAYQSDDGSGDVEEHLGLYDQKYYNPLSMDKRITEATKDALPEVVRNYPNLSQFNQAPIFIEQDEDNALGRHLKNNNGMGIVNLLAADAHKVADEPYQEMKRTMQHELGHGIIDNALAEYVAHEEMGHDIPQPLRNIADWHDDDDEGLVEELPHSIYDKDLDRSRWNTVNQYYKKTGEPMDITMRLLKEESQGQLYNEDLFDGLLGEGDLVHYDEMNDKQRAIIDAKMALPAHLFSEGSEMGENMNRYLFSRSMHEKVPEYHYDDELEYLQHFNDAMQPFVNNHERTLEITNNGDEEHPEHPHNVAMSRMHPDFENRMSTIFRLYKASEPMDLAMRLLKEMVI